MDRHFVFINNTYLIARSLWGSLLSMHWIIRQVIRDCLLLGIWSWSPYFSAHKPKLPGFRKYLAQFFLSGRWFGRSTEANDSLTLQFLAPQENIWYSVWRAEGNSDQNFKPVIIRIDQPRFLKKGFQFRFINYASSALTWVTLQWLGIVISGTLITCFSTKTGMPLIPSFPTCFHASTSLPSKESWSNAMEKFGRSISRRWAHQYPFIIAIMIQLPEM